MFFRHFLSIPILVLVAMTPSTLTAQEVTNVETGYIETDDGTRLYYRRKGTGKHAVVVPGGLFTFDGLKVLAGKDRTLVFYDMRGRGRSDAIADDKRPGMVGIHHDVNDVERLREHFGFEKISLIGYSYLGLMTVLYAMENPDRVERVVQLGPVPLKFGTVYPKEFTNTDRLADIGASADEVARVEAMRSGDYYRTNPKDYCEMEWVVTRYRLVGNPANVDKLGASKCNMPNEYPANLEKHFQHSFASVQKLDVPRGKLAAVKMPVLTIHGTKDRNAVYGAGREWATILPNARLVTVKGAAHQSWVDEPELVFSSINEFLRGRWPKTAEKISAGN